MPCLDAPPQDLIVFVLDDLRTDQLPLLEETLARLDPIAVRFDRAYVTTPMCCPERASFLSGGYLPQNVGVLTNEAPMGGATVFYDEVSLATRLQAAGYHTALIGKYLNEYDELGLYVPPGWTSWAATIGEEGWIDFESIEGSSTPTASSTATREPHDGYITTWQGRKARELWEAADGTPLFLYVSFHAPHDPHIPAPQDRGTFADFSYRGGAYEEADLSDKPAWIQAIPLMSAEEEAEADRVIRERQETLLSADRAIASFLDGVLASERAAHTVIVLTSDNGMLWREHRLSEKGLPYEESVRVPLLIAAPGLSPVTLDGLVAMNLDLAATIQALAGLALEGDGQSLLPMICDGEPGRDAVALQSWGKLRASWAALVTPTEKLVDWDDGSRELYDLALDPFELESQHADLARVGPLLERLNAARGLSPGPTTLADARVGSAYRQALDPRGGTAPLRWSAAGTLPPGLRLSEDGVVEGTPTAEGTFRFLAIATDASVSALHGGPQQVQGTLQVRIQPAEQRACGCRDGRAALVLGLFGLTRRKSGDRPRVGVGGAIRPVLHFPSALLEWARARWRT